MIEDQKLVLLSSFSVSYFGCLIQVSLEAMDYRIHGIPKFPREAPLCIYNVSCDEGTCIAPWACQVSN